MTPMQKEERQSKHAQTESGVADGGVLGGGEKETMEKRSLIDWNGNGKRGNESGRWK